jgi:hypothetical protein
MKSIPNAINYRTYGSCHGGHEFFRSNEGAAKSQITKRQNEKTKEQTKDSFLRFVLVTDTLTDTTKSARNE